MEWYLGHNDAVGKPTQFFKQNPTFKHYDPLIEEGQGWMHEYQIEYVTDFEKIDKAHKAGKVADWNGYYKTGTIYSLSRYNEIAEKNSKDIRIQKTKLQKKRKSKSAFTQKVAPARKSLFSGDWVNVKTKTRRTQSTPNVVKKEPKRPVDRKTVKEDAFMKQLNIYVKDVQSARSHGKPQGKEAKFAMQRLACFVINNM